MEKEQNFIKMEIKNMKVHGRKETETEKEQNIMKMQIKNMKENLKKIN